MVEGEAEHWWNLVKQTWRELGTEPTWENVLVAFDEKYFPDSVRERKEVEFIELQQGNMVGEHYATRFTELSRYAPHIVNTEAWKVVKFERGLWLDIRDRVMSANLKSYAPMVDFALKIERDCENHRSRKEGKMKAAFEAQENTPTSSKKRSEKEVISAEPEIPEEFPEQHEQ
ncbi:uncharacterized protein LOC105420220 [Amborella trichopoda]|uniref:uncharacterized protein LOC105420220 n=1 Tax=Amborella trichopoda TaxID=13333 RepID=UPI0005D40B65|nr:uncharacterized protein LOC105420220 [Amborella trichopoda]|eukprot:XP_011621279.1 uncharacterized protein LOC105420220 [Amborella trichopoda]